MQKGAKLLSVLAMGVACAALVAPGQSEAKVEGDTITLGAALSFTGKYSSNGKHTKNGYELAAKMINEAGGITVQGKSYKLKIQYYDDESTPARSAQLLERLITQDGIRYILGPYGSGPTAAMAPVVEQFKVPMVEGNGASRSIFNKGYKYTFAVLSTSEQYLASSVALAAEWAEANGRDASSVTIALAMENDPFSQDIRAGVMDDAKKFGMTIVIDDKLPPELNDMTATLTKVKALKPDMLVVSGHSKGAALAVRQVSEMKVNVPILAMTHCEAAKVQDKFPGLSDYTLCATQWDETLSYNDPLFGSAMDFSTRFKSEYDDYTVVPYQAAESAAAVYVYAKAIEAANSFQTESVRDAIAATDMMTFYGHVDFDDTGKNIAKPMGLRQIIDGKYLLVAPAKFASTKVIIPMPTWDQR